MKQALIETLFFKSFFKSFDFKKPKALGVLLGAFVAGTTLTAFPPAAHAETFSDFFSRFTGQAPSTPPDSPNVPAPENRAGPALKKAPSAPESDTPAQTDEKASSTDSRPSATPRPVSKVFYGAGRDKCSAWTSSTPAEADKTYSTWVQGAFSGYENACLQAHDASSCGGNTLSLGGSAKSGAQGSAGQNGNGQNANGQNGNGQNAKLISDSVKLICALSPQSEIGTATYVAWQQYAKLGTFANALTQMSGVFKDLMEKAEAGAQELEDQASGDQEPATPEPGPQEQGTQESGGASF